MGVIITVNCLDGNKKEIPSHKVFLKRYEKLANFIFFCIPHKYESLRVQDYTDLTLYPTESMNFISWWK